jgi:hypothetical protein
MLAFVVPLKSARVAVSWERVQKMFLRTITSTCAQISPEFRVVVACHEIPESNFSHPKLEFVQVKHAAPSTPDPSSMRDDKKRKHLIALHRAMEYSPTHVMFLDSDDLVSNRLAGFVCSQAADVSWHLRSGYFCCERQSRLHLERWRFDKWCGSSHIVQVKHVPLIKSTEKALILDHSLLLARLRHNGAVSRPLPFPGAIYTVAHGDNFRNYESIVWPSHPVLRSLRRLLFHRAVTPQIREEFGLYAIE